MGPVPWACFGEEGWGHAWSLDPGTQPGAVNGSPRLAGGKGVARGVEQPWLLDCPSWEARLSGDSQPRPPWLGPWPLSLAPAGGCMLPHASLLRQLRNPRILSEPEHAKEGRGKVLAFRDLGMVQDLPLCSALLVHPCSRTCLG